MTPGTCAYCGNWVDIGIHRCQKMPKGVTT